MSHTFYSRLLWICLIAAVEFCTSSCLPFKPTTVTHLPGFHGVLPSRLETGYVTVDRRNGAEVFYYFMESEGEPKKDPVLLWLSGGPACSSFYAFYQEIGPMRFMNILYNETLPTLVYNPYTWTKFFNIIFLDWLPGSGFAFSKHPEHQILDDDHSIDQIYIFLRQWFLDHPNFLLNPFYAGGDSYGGKVATLISYRIAQGIEASDQPLINFKGYLIGNPRTGIDEIDINPRVDHAHELAIISDEIMELIEKNCAGENYRHPKSVHCIAHIRVLKQFIGEIVIDNVLNLKCGVDRHDDLKQRYKGKSLTMSSKTPNIDDTPTSFVPNCPDYATYLVERWMNDYPFTREAIGVKEGTVGTWVVCELNLKRKYKEYKIPSTLPHHHYLLTRGYRALVYSGDHDLQFPTRGTLKWIEYLNFPVIQRWRSWKISGQVAGYTVLYSNNLTFATVKGAGHEAPQDKPRECWNMLKRWISYEPL